MPRTWEEVVAVATSLSRLGVLGPDGRPASPFCFDRRKGGAAGRDGAAGRGVDGVWAGCWGLSNERIVRLRLHGLRSDFGGAGERGGGVVGL